MKRKAKPVKAWGYVTDGILCPWGNGKQFQFPIFRTRDDALDWQSTHATVLMRLARVEIREIKR